MSTQKHWASKQLSKQDEVRDFVSQSVDLVLRRRKEFALGTGGLLAAIALIGFFLYSRAARENEAWDKLSMAEAYSYLGRAQEASTALAEVSDQSASPAAAALAGMMQGELKRTSGDHDAAQAALSRAAEVAPEPLKPLAMAEKVFAFDAAGKPAECAAAAQSFLDAHADHFLGPRVQEVMSRCQLALGQTEAARATWQKIALQYPDTPWAQRANARLQPPAK